MKHWMISLLLGLSCAASANVSLFNAETQKALQAVNGSLMSAPVADLPQPDSSALETLGAYRPSADVNRQVRDDVIARIQSLGKASGMDAQTAQSMTEGMREVDVPAAIWPELEKLGYPRDNLVTATAFWLIVNWEILHERENTPAENQAIVAQLTAHYANSGALETMSAQDLQYGAEAMIWIAALQQMLFDQARQSGDRAKINAAQNDALLALQSLGFDPHKLTLSEQGFSLK